MIASSIHSLKSICCEVWIFNVIPEGETPLKVMAPQKVFLRFKVMSVCLSYPIYYEMAEQFVTKFGEKRRREVRQKGTVAIKEGAYNLNPAC